VNFILLMWLLDPRKQNPYDLGSDDKLVLGIAYGFLVIMLIIFGAVIYTGVQQGLWPWG
jgi:hypothetical protein